MLHKIRNDKDVAVFRSRLDVAIKRQEPMTITYRKAAGEVTIRTIEPVSTGASKDGSPLIYVLDRDSRAPRTFRTDRVISWTAHPRAHRTLDHHG